MYWKYTVISTFQVFHYTVKIVKNSETVKVSEINLKLRGQIFYTSILKVLVNKMKTVLKYF